MRLWQLTEDGCLPLFPIAPSYLLGISTFRGLLLHFTKVTMVKMHFREKKIPRAFSCDWFVLLTES